MFQISLMNSFMRYIFYALIIYFIILLIRVYRDKKTGNKFDLNSNKTIGGKKNNTPKIIKKYRSINKGESVKKLHDMYFYFLNQIHEEHKKGNIRRSEEHTSELQSRGH